MNNFRGSATGRAISKAIGCELAMSRAAQHSCVRYAKWTFTARSRTRGCDTSFWTVASWANAVGASARALAYVITLAVAACHCLPVEGHAKLTAFARASSFFRFDALTVSVRATWSYENPTRTLPMPRPSVRLLVRERA